MTDLNLDQTYSTEEVLDAHFLLAAKYLTIGKKLINVERNASTIRRQIENMSKVPEFLNYFHHSDFQLQQSIIVMLSNGKCLWNAFMHLKLVNDTGSDARVVSSWNILDSQTRDLYARTDDAFPSNALSDKAYLLFAHMAGRSQSKLYTPPQINARTLLLLAVKFDEDRVIEVIDAWLRDKPENSFYDFIQIVENWEKVKDYPLSWSLQTLSTHKC